MDAKMFFRESLAQAARVVEMVIPENFKKPTPDTDWTVIDLLRHMFYELAWVSELIAGKTVAEVGSKYDGDLIGDNLAVQWQGYQVAALDAVETTDLNATVHLSYGDKTAGDYLREVGSDLAIHAWDLGEGIDHPVVYDSSLAEALYTQAKTTEEMIRSSGLFGPELEVESSADTQTKLLALYGRTSQWKAV